MLLLVLPHGHVVRMVQENVRRHQGRIGKEAMGGLKAMGQLVLVGVAPLQKPHGADTGQKPGKLLHLRNIRLTPENSFLRINATGQEIHRNLVRPRPQLLRLRTGGHGVVVGDEIVALVLLLGRHGLAHGAKVVAKVKGAGGLYARQNALVADHRVS